MKDKPTAKIYVGIDPAFRDKGFTICIIDTEDNSVLFKKFKMFKDFCFWVIYEAPPKEDVIFCVENSNLTGASFDLKGSAAVIARKSRNVGMNQAISQNTVDILLAFDFYVVDLSPKDKGAKYTDYIFRSVAKSNNHKVPKIVSQDARDAYKLAGLAKQKSYLAK